MSELTVGSLSGLASNSYVIDVASGSTLDLSNGATLPSGSVLQVVQATKTDTFTTTSGTPVDITGYSVSITPSSTTSKILVINSFHIGQDPSASYPRLLFLRDATSLIVGDARGGTSQITGNTQVYASSELNLFNFSFSYLDSPNTTSAVTYKWQVSTYLGRTFTFNGSHGSSDSNRMSAASTMIAMEIAG